MKKPFVIQGDPVVAAMFAKHGWSPFKSQIAGIDLLATAFNRENLGSFRRIVDLSCCHKAVTRNIHSMKCPRCSMLMKHGFDYEAWLRGVSDWWPYDGMHWREDPCRHFNEKTDLAGNFINDPEDKRDKE